MISDEGMANRKDESKTEALSARVEAGTHEAMRASVPKGYHIGQVYTVATKLWLGLPKDIQRDLLIGRQPSNLEELVRRIVREERDAEAQPDTESEGAHKNRGRQK